MLLFQSGQCRRGGDKPPATFLLTPTHQNNFLTTQYQARSLYGSKTLLYLHVSNQWILVFVFTRQLSVYDAQIAEIMY